MKGPSRVEADRIAELLSYDLLDTPFEEAFDRLTALAAEIFDAPIALVSLIDADRQWFKSRVGMDIASGDRSTAFCDHAIRQEGHSVMVVPDASQDPRFADNPYVTGPGHVRFYAGAVLTTPSGHNLGALCVVDTKPRPQPTAAQIKQLRALARIAVDEMELRRANREARENHRTLDLAESLAGIGRWRLDLGTGRVAWSDAVYAIHGVDRQTFDPNLDEAIAFYHPDDRDTVRFHLQTAIAERVSFEFQLRLIRPGGELRHVVSKGACDVGPTGAASAVFGVFQDVTDQVRRLEETRRSEAQYRLLAENACDVIMRSDSSGRLTYISPAALTVTGRHPEQMMGRPWSDFVHPADASRVDAALHEQLRAQGACSAQAIEYRLRHTDGHDVWLQGRPSFAIDPDSGQTAGVTDVVRDISAQKEDEEELRQARSEAEAAAAVKAEFLANMSHELRTPLTAVLGFSALIGEQPDLSPVTQTYLARVTNAGQTLLATVDDILDFTKLESGLVQIKPQDADAAQLARDVIDLFALQASEKGLALAVEGLDALPPRVMLDARCIRQVLLNLLGNAVKFTQAGGIRLETRFDPAAGRLSFTVIDSGPGIAPEDAARLFRRFSQVDGSTTRRFGGTGLGLAICKGLVDAMGGQIGVRSVLGQGAQFWVWIPVDESAPAVQQPVTDDVKPQLAGSLPAGCRVLLAEDNQVNRTLVRAVLEGLDMAVTEACDGLEAVETAQALPFDLILMDMRMPRLDGIAATRRIRSEDGPNIHVPIIAFSADVTAGLGLGLFDALVAKPLTAAALVQAMADVMAPYEETDHAAA